MPETADHLTLRQRIVVVGSTGSGKTTLARRAAMIIGGRHIELDALQYGPGWTKVDAATFRDSLHAAIDGEARWVTCGGYRSYVCDITWPLADQIVWIDLPFAVTYSRMVRRTFARRMRNEELWHGNRESLRSMFLSRDSLFLFAIQHRNKYRKTYPAAFREPALAHVPVARLRRPRDVKAWLRGLGEEWGATEAPQ